MFSSKPTNKLKEWTYYNPGDMHLYVHPDLELNYLESGNKTLILLGYWLNPHFFDKTNEDILKEISLRLMKRFFLNI